MSYSRIKSMNTVSSGPRRNRNTCSSFPKFCFSDTEAQIPFSIKIHKNLPGIGEWKLAMLWLGQEKSFSNGKRLVFPENDKRRETL